MFNKLANSAFIDEGPFLKDHHVQLFIRRLDLIDTVYGGNKWFKLKYNLLKAKEKGISNIVSFGGVFSNHIAALARIGSLCGIQTYGIIRGEMKNGDNVTLSRAAADGMQLLFCSREMYRKKKEPGFISQFPEIPINHMLIPEGGSNLEGVLGAAEILSEKDSEFDYITVCCGTGATAAGLLLKLKSHQHLIGYSVLRDHSSIEKEIETHIENKLDVTQKSHWHIEHDFHFGGYAKSSPELVQFMNWFKTETTIPIEVVYTGKMFYGIVKMIQSGYFPKGSKILAIHTGGLQYLHP
ncbi:MAG: pyridoxal-phosphate dependent enzyme [Bacteroidetes bacterium]|nr:pyridoxal-phosphate dependent enzyme [Bacteroidota bacterium]